ncbi:MAG TPA: cardiolipin synthase ClsB [Nitrosomonas sp.]|jgi:cardiolipin synthase|nr:cardiolipin synthase ClsB [Nitrosomonas sp.]MBP6355041.1 cardiolipin synthase ClsB [Nitrosomonas sp.]MBP9871013.1 cardiolipin synthase ClsB [Nitrosomonas sp.]MDO8334762.1 cardiolipin synthase ClsB [Nitrosomonas sp.]HQV88791.1 cardiolipin synthase ClsB [Nitrosomonas sp.]
MKNSHYVEHNHITLLHNGHAYFPKLEAAIETAQFEIYIETYIFEYDAIGIRIAEALKRAARRGVSVHLLLDGFGSQNLSHATIQDMLGTGMQVLIFRPEFIFSMPHRYRLRRMHRKLVTIDAQIAFVGGINIIDDQHNPENLTPRFDYAVLIKGPLLIQIHAAVRHLWMLVAWVHLKKRWINPIVIKPTIMPCGDQKAMFLIRDNLRHRHDIEHAYLEAIHQAHTEIIIANAYFLPGRKFSNALKNAAQRGVRVELLLQGKIEYRLQHHATQAMYENLLNAGIKIHEYNRSYLHAKVAVIDQHWATVGSSNIDPFSLLLAREANIFVEDQHFADELRSSLKTAIAEESTPVMQINKGFFSWHYHAINWLSFHIVRMMQGVLGYDWHDSKP